MKTIDFHNLTDTLNDSFKNSLYIKVREYVNLNLRSKIMSKITKYEMLRVTIHSQESII